MILYQNFLEKSLNIICGAGLNSLFIDEEGNMCPCQLFYNDPKHYMGNIFSDIDTINEKFKYISKKYFRK